MSQVKEEISPVKPQKLTVDLDTDLSLINSTEEDLKQQKIARQLHKMKKFLYECEFDENDIELLTQNGYKTVKSLYYLDKGDLLDFNIVHYKCKKLLKRLKFEKEQREKNYKRFGKGVGAFNINLITTKIKYHFTIKLILLGDSKVGKTSLLNRLQYNVFNEESNRTISPQVSFLYASDYNGQNVQIVVHDTAGQEQFDSITKNYYRESHAAILVYSVDEKNSLNGIKKWVKNVEQNNSVKNFKKVLVCNKIDLKESFNSDHLITKGINYALTNDMSFRAASAKKGFHVKEIFQEASLMVLNDKYLVSYIKQQQKEEREKNARIDSDLNQIPQKEKTNCC